LSALSSIASLLPFFFFPSLFSPFPFPNTRPRQLPCLNRIAGCSSVSTASEAGRLATRRRGDNEVYDKSRPEDLETP
jgi:hypothetical protein